MTDRNYIVQRWTHEIAEHDHKHGQVVEITVNDRAAVREAIIHRVIESGMNFVTRSDWAASKNRSANMKDDWNYTMIAIHHAGRSMSCGPAALQLQDVQHFQMHEEGFDDIGYHYAIDCMGNVFEGRDVRFQGQHLKHYNTGAIGIVLLENLTVPGEGTGIESQFTKLFFSMPEAPESQIASAKKLVLVLSEFFPIKILGGHREFPYQHEKNKICPGNVGMGVVINMRKVTGLKAP
jgi:hypothetical protein